MNLQPILPHLPQNRIVMLSTLQAWANLGWITKGLVSECHAHECTDCRVSISCRCADKDALWTTCLECAENKAA